ncbi:DUF4286 family protein [Desertibaculum subflavum]|uniref:DUF4286 family protein n=1 Tax=Desertibaculum subflavum TaxID=2268458 RepID=UPI0013C52685
MLIVTAEVDPEVEADWNRWYDDVHLPDALLCPGVLSRRRFVSKGPISESDRGARCALGKTLCTTIYQLASPAAVSTPEFTAMRGWGRFTPNVRSQTRVIVALAQDGSGGG